MAILLFKISKTTILHIAEIVLTMNVPLNQQKNDITGKKMERMLLNFKLIKAEKLASKNSKAYWDIKRKANLNLDAKINKFSETDYKILSNYCKKLKIDFYRHLLFDAIDFLNH